MKTTSFTVLFKQWLCTVMVGNYNTANGPLAIQLVDKETHERIAIATVHVPEIQPMLDDQDAVLIKTWSGNEGIDDALKAAGVIMPNTLGQYACGYTNAVIARLTPAFLEETQGESQ